MRNPYQTAKLCFLLYLSVLLLINISRALADTTSVRTNENVKASQLAGVPITIRCFPRLQSGADGLTWHLSDGTTTWWQPTIDLPNSLCRGLDNLERHNLTQRPGTVYTMATAIFVVTHEAYHIQLNSEDESLVECTAYRNIYNVIKSYGYDSRETTKLYKAAKAYHLAAGPDYRKVC